jgi:hypothetical protein
MEISKMKEIKLTRGYVAIIDDDDFERVSKIHWQCMPNRYGKVYAKGCLPLELRNESKKQQQVLMHRFVMNAKPNTELDHINGNGLDNRKENLRFTSHRENLRNRRLFQNSGSGFKGVRKKGNKYIMVLQVEFDTPEDAAKLWDKLAKTVYGKHARLNFPK